MIAYFATAEHRYTMDTYLSSWGATLRTMIQVHDYDELAGAQALPGGTYIFSDLERLTTAQRALVAAVWSQLEAAAPNARLLNHPTRMLGRVDLLRDLHAAGRNDFQVYRVAETRTPARFPVFLRRANDHDGSLTALLRSQEEVDTQIRAALWRGQDPRQLVLAEFCDTADAEGIHHKFAAFGVAGRIIPRHVIYSRQWVLKYPDLLDESKIAREHEYLQTNPHEAALRETFQRARIDYGRCDYAVVNGRIQVWEINTNPVVMLLPEEYQPAHLPAQEHFAARIRAAFEAVNLEIDPGLRIPIRLERDTVDRVIAATTG